MPVPFFFKAESGERLFAIVNTIDSQSPVRTGVLICPAFGEERQKIYRSTFHFAKLLEGNGIPSLRFDYRGTGDSEGSLSDISLDGMIADGRMAAQFAYERLQCKELVVVGIRFGAAIAARIASEFDEINTCVMWNPIVNGSNYARSLRRTEKLIRLSGIKGSEPPITPPDTDELMVIEADLMTSQLSAEIESVDLVSEPLSLSHLLVTGRADDEKEKASIESFVASKESAISRIDCWLEQPRDYWSTRSMYDAYFPTLMFEKTLAWIQSLRKDIA